MVKDETIDIKEHINADNLSDELKNKIKTAITIGEINQLRYLAGEVRETDEALADHFLGLIDGFELAKMQKLFA